MSPRILPLILALACAFPTLQAAEAPSSDSATPSAPVASKPADQTVLDIRTRTPSRPGYRAQHLEVITSVPFTPLSRLSGSSLEYLLPLIQPKISGVTVAGEASSFSYDGRELYVGATVKYPRRADMNISNYFADAPSDKPSPGAAAAGEGTLRVRAIHADRIVFTDEAGYELPVPVRVNSDDNDQEGNAMRVQMNAMFAVGVINEAGSQVYVRLPDSIPDGTVMRVSTRFANSRNFTLERRAHGVAVLAVDGEPLGRPKAADVIPLPRMPGYYALGASGGSEGFDLLGLPLDREGDHVHPRGRAYSEMMVAAVPVWTNGILQGFTDERGLLLSAPAADEKVDLCLVTFVPPAAP